MIRPPSFLFLITLLVGPVLFTTGCSHPVLDGLTFVGKGPDGHLIMGFVTCDDPIQNFTVYYSKESGGTASDIDVGRWSLKSPAKFATLDPNAPGPQWTVEKALLRLDSNAVYTTIAGSASRYAGQTDFSVLSIEKLSPNSYLGFPPDSSKPTFQTISSMNKFCL